jgi:sister-chromatid-cohesion protein PDS5
MELILADDLFPDDLSVEERTNHWIHMFSLFSSCHEKALNTILIQKRRYQSGNTHVLCMLEGEILEIFTNYSSIFQVAG